jgi:hypothetical protein
MCWLSLNLITDYPGECLSFRSALDVLFNTFVSHGDWLRQHPFLEIGPARPAFVRSEIRSRSNSDSAAKIPNTILPAAVVVSMDAPCPVSTLKPIPCGAL